MIFSLKLTWNRWNTHWVSTCISQRPTHGETWIVLRLQPHPRRSHILSIPAFVALNAPIPRLNPLLLIWIIRLMIPGNLLGIPDPVSILNGKSLRLNLLVNHHVATWPQAANNGSRIPRIGCHYGVARDHDSHHSSPRELIAKLLEPQPILILGKAFTEDLLELSHATKQVTWCLLETLILDLCQLSGWLILTLPLAFYFETLSIFDVRCTLLASKQIIQAVMALLPLLTEAFWVIF